VAVTTKHKVFISYHHAEDEWYKKEICRRLEGDFVDRSIEDGDINPLLSTDYVRQKIRDEFIADATVTVVLIGRCTWQRKHVDWEIGSSLRDTKNNSRCGMLGIILPTHKNYQSDTYNSRLIPPRLADNCGSKGQFGKIYNWPTPWSTDIVRNWIHDAFKRRLSVTPNNGRKQFGQNRSGSCENGW